MPYILGSDSSFADLPPLDGEEGELIDDEACFIDAMAVSGIGERYILYNRYCCLGRIILRRCSNVGHSVIFRKSGAFARDVHERCHLGMEVLAYYHSSSGSYRRRVCDGQLLAPSARLASGCEPALAPRGVTSSVLSFLR